MSKTNWLFRRHPKWGRSMPKNPRRRIDGKRWADVAFAPPDNPWHAARSAHVEQKRRRK